MEKALQQFSSHEKSGMHREAVAKLEARSSTVNVGVMLSKQYDTEKKQQPCSAFEALTLHLIPSKARPFIPQQ